MLAITDREDELEVGGGIYSDEDDGSVVRIPIANRRTAGGETIDTVVDTLPAKERVESSPANEGLPRHEESESEQDCDEEEHPLQVGPVKSSPGRMRQTRKRTENGNQQICQSDVAACHSGAGRHFQSVSTFLTPPFLSLFWCVSSSLTFTVQGIPFTVHIRILSFVLLPAPPFLPFFCGTACAGSVLLDRYSPRGLDVPVGADRRARGMPNFPSQARALVVVQRRLL